MDNPIVNFGLSPYQPDEDINLTVDNFASAGGFIYTYIHAHGTYIFIISSNVLRCFHVHAYMHVCVCVCSYPYITGLLRGLFEYRYSATDITLVPHHP